MESAHEVILIDGFANGAVLDRIRLQLYIKFSLYNPSRVCVAQSKQRAVRLLKFCSEFVWY